MIFDFTVRRIKKSPTIQDIIKIYTGNMSSVKRYDFACPEIVQLKKETFSKIIEKIIGNFKNILEEACSDTTKLQSQIKAAYENTNILNLDNFEKYFGIKPVELFKSKLVMRWNKIKDECKFLLNEK